MSNPLDELVRVNENSRPTWVADAPPDPKKRRRILLQVLLFLLTILSTTMTGGWAYSATLILILLFHEMGHYFAARYYGVPATLPYFIPFPLSILGTSRYPATGGWPSHSISVRSVASISRPAL